VVVENILDFGGAGVDVDDFIAPIDDIAFGRDKDVFVLRKEDSLRSPALFAKPKNFRLMAGGGGGGGGP